MPRTNISGEMNAMSFKMETGFFMEEEREEVR
jgi:hypothetical protein